MKEFKSSKAPEVSRMQSSESGPAFQAYAASTISYVAVATSGYYNESANPNGIGNYLTDSITAPVLREPDDEWLRINAEFLRRTGDVEDLIRRFLGSEEFKGKADLFLRTHLAERETPFFNDHSQWGEVELLIKSLVSGAVKNHMIVDVGARGRERSNSYDLIKFWNWKGILIEANPFLIQGLQDDFNALDVEGEDIKALNDLIDHTGYRPSWVIIEISSGVGSLDLNDYPFVESVRNMYEVAGHAIANLVLKRVG